MRKFSAEHIKHLSESHKGKPNPNKGKKLPPLSLEARKKISAALKGKPSHFPRRYGEENNKWKGDDVGYTGLHQWVRRKLGKPAHCAYCGRADRRKYEWANISKSYRRDLSDWIRLCTSCHRLYDNGKIKI